MADRNISSEEHRLIKRAHALLPGGSVGNIYNDVIVRRGAGSHVWDVSGNEYIDYLLGSGPMIVGHTHPEVVEAVREQLEDGTTFFAIHEQAIALAEQIVAAVQCAEKVRFTSSGTEATALAIRAARAFRQRDRVLKFEGGYHGMNEVGLMSLAPKFPPTFPLASTDSAGIPPAMQDGVLIAPFNDISMTTSLVEQYHDELAAVIVEPFQRLICPQPGFLQALREVTQQYSVPLIFDEIVTGFRFSYGGAQEYYGVTPDLCTLGKAVAGGFPMAAIAGREEIMHGFDPAALSQGNFLPQIGTLNGNPVAATAGLATLKVLRQEGVYERLFDTGRQLMNAFRHILDQVGIPGQVVGEPPVFDVVFTDREIVDYRTLATGNSDQLKKFNHLLLAHGIFRGDTKFYVSLAHDQKDIDQTISAFEAAVGQLDRQS